MTWPLIAPHGLAGRQLLFGIIAGFSLLVIYLFLWWLFSGSWGFVYQQWRSLWSLMLSLTLIIGAQFALLVGLRHMSRSMATTGSAGLVVGSTGGTTLSMAACCAHHLFDIAPWLAAGGVLGFLGQYQLPMLWLSLVIALAVLFQLWRRHARLYPRYLEVARLATSAGDML